MPDYRRIRMTQTSEHEARVQATGLITAKFIEMANGNTEPIYESINKLMNEDPELLGGVALTLLNLLVAFVSANGENMTTFQEFCDFLIKSLADDTPSVQRLVN